MIAYGGSDNESSIRNAFERCLDAYCRDHREKLRLVPEIKTGAGIFPDGTVKDTLRMARGYWEAKDTHDDLETEIQKKFNRGYPRDNIIFEDSQTAVLFQNREEAMRVDMTRPGELHRLIRRFLDYELPEIEEFRQAQQQFKADLPAVLDNLRGAVDAAQAGNVAYQAAAQTFLEQCHQTISPHITATDVREMLLQHILTQDIFLRVFAESQFHHENSIARQLENLERTFFTGDVRREAIDRLRAYYGAIGRAADEIADYAESSSSSRPSTRISTRPTTPPPPTASAWSTPPTRWWTSSSAAPTICCKSTLAAPWPTTTCRFSTRPPAPAPSLPT